MHKAVTSQLGYQCHRDVLDGQPAGTPERASSTASAGHRGTRRSCAGRERRPSQPRARRRFESGGVPGTPPERREPRDRSHHQLTLPPHADRRHDGNLDGSPGGGDSAYCQNRRRTPAPRAPRSDSGGIAAAQRRSAPIRRRSRQEGAFRGGSHRDVGVGQQDRLRHSSASATTDHCEADCSGRVPRQTVCEPTRTLRVLNDRKSDPDNELVEFTHRRAQHHQRLRIR